MARRGERVPARTREEILRLHRNGVQVKEISTRFGVSRKFIYELVKEARKLSEAPGL